MISSCFSIFMDFKVKKKEKGREEMEVGDKFTYLYLMNFPRFACFYCENGIKLKEEMSLASLPLRSVILKHPIAKTLWIQ